MNAKRMIAVLAGICLVVPAVVLALDAPINLSVVVGVDAVSLDWDDVTDAVKYSVDIEGAVTYWDAILVAEATVPVEVSFGTSDRTDGGVMGDSHLTITIDDLAAAIAAELGVLPADLTSLDGIAKVKALDPGKDKGRQNNPFSDPVDLDVFF